MWVTMASTTDKLTFLADWYDRESCRFRHFLLTYFLSDGSVQLYETGASRLFLKRIAVPTVTVDDLWVGSRVTVFGRQLDLTGYGNGTTERLLWDHTQRTFAMIKPDGLAHMGAILREVTDSRLRVVSARTVQLSRSDAEHFYQEHAGREFYPALVDYMTSGPVLGLELMGSDSVQRWRQMIGPTDCARAREQAPRSIRARFGSDGTRNVAHGSDSLQAALRELDFFFSVAPPRATSADVRDTCSTCVVLLPHVVREGRLAAALESITADGRFEVRALQLVRLTEQRARQFLQVYEGVLAEFPSMVQQLSSGPAVAMQVVSPCLGPQTVDTFRQLAGPRDPALASMLRPDSLRARFGSNKVLNAVHCTDMVDDVRLELQFFFS